MNKDIKINLLLSAIFGALIWALSPYIVGHTEPWDSDTYYYFASIGVVGFILSLIRPNNLWAYATGIFIGQFLYILVFLPIGPLLVVGTIFLLFSSAVCYFSSMAAKLLKESYKHA